MSTRHCRGFTLIEILVALAVLAISLFAIIKMSSENVANTAHVRDKTIAQWTALNLLTEMQVQKSWPTIGAANGQQEMAGRDWYWTSLISQTSDADVRKVEISVLHSSDDNALVTLSGYIAKP